MVKKESPSEIIELAQGCVYFVHKALGMELDYTQDTLPILDHYLSSARKLEREKQPSVDQDPELLRLLVPSAGAYFGEVIRRVFPETRWHCAGDDHSEYRLEFVRCFLHFNPMGAALEAITGKTEPGWQAYFQMFDEDQGPVSEALAATQVSEEDYYRLAVRYETLEHVESLLMAFAQQRGDMDRIFPAAVYEASTC